ncbi:transposase IS66 family protein [bacterium BMS3Abin13]|nr:transposase IS66 family protein [bacterium BMS3Abin13]
MISDVSTLPDTPDSLKGIVIALQGEIAALHDRYERETRLLHEQIRLLRAQLYGRRSEKVVPADGPRPLPLFDLPEPPADEEEEEVRVPAHTRKKRGRKPLPEDLPRVVEVHDIDDADKVCACGCDLQQIGEEVSEQLDIIPAKVRVIRHIRPKYACPKCEGVEDDGPTVKIAPVQPQIIPKSIVSPGLLAHIMTGKFIDHTPFYRQEKQLVRLGVDVSRTSMCRWAMQAASACRPLLNLLEEELLAGPFINIDETTVQVLQEPGRSPTTKSYMWIFRRGDPRKPVLLYQYHPTRSGDVANAFLRGFQGTVQTDGYAGYDFLDHTEGIRHIGCWAHARRKFTDVTKAQGKSRKAGAADKALSYIKKLYRLEKTARDNKYSPEQIYRMRQQEARPILDDFEKWLAKKKLQTPPKGLLGKAVAYTLNQWHRLIGYTEDGNLTIDNNMAENSIRPFVIGRKNWLFSGTPEGAEASALLYSLIETVKANKLEPYAYLRYIFEKLPLASSLEDYEALLPWNITPEQMGCLRLVQCG